MGVSCVATVQDDGKKGRLGSRIKKYWIHKKYTRSKVFAAKDLFRQMMVPSLYGPIYRQCWRGKSDETGMDGRLLSI